VTAQVAPALVRCLAPVVLVLGACRAPAPLPAASTPAPPLSAPAPRLELPASLEPERGAYERDVREGLARVAAFFRTAGVELPDTALIDSAVVFDTLAAARDHLAAEFGAPPDAIPETFSGTVVGRRLFLVSRRTYREIWRTLYPDWPWTDGTYGQLIVHELAHRAHESVAIARRGSAEAMGPAWFFEGLAVVCAGQFETGKPPLSREEIELLVGPGRTPPVSYPLYGRIVRSLAAETALKTLMARASDPGFPEVLWADRAVRTPAGG
jgi:hypothetical protein